MQLVEKHMINKNHIHFNECDNLCFLSKNLYNKANFLVRQEFIKSSKEKEDGLREYAIYLSYQDIRRILIKDINYTSLPRKVSNQTLMLLDKNWKSFFKTIKDYSKNKNKYNGKPKLPNYKNKVDGRFITTYEEGAISKKDLKKGLLGLSGTNIKIPTRKTNIKQCRIIPKNDYYVIEIIYSVSEKEILCDNNRYCGVDLGLNNLAALSFNDKIVKPIIINGKPLKSINQYYNKEKSRLQSILEKRNKNKQSKRINKLINKRNNKINDYLHKSSRYIINHLVSNNVNTLIIGNNKEWKQEINIGKANNQNFVNIPHSTFIQMLEYKAKLVGINIIIREESYTSKCSFLDKEDVKKHDVYLGRRIKRGLFKSSNGRLINADLNGSYNIMRKAIPNVFADGIEGVSVHPTVITVK
jgi:putative transposase